MKKFIDWVSENEFWQFALVWEISAIICAVLACSNGYSFSIWEGVLLVVFPFLAQICVPIVIFLLALAMSIADCFKRHEAREN